MELFVIALAYIGILVYLANVEQVTGNLSPLVLKMQYGVAVLLSGLVFNALAFILIPMEAVTDPEVYQQLQAINPLAMQIFVIITILAIGLIIWIIRSPNSQNLLVKWLRINTADEVHGYDSTLSVHRTALILAIMQIVVALWSFIVVSGASGTINDLIFTAMIYIVMALLGVGWMIRRNTSDTTQRLGLRIPTGQDVMLGIAIGIGLYILSLVGSIMWQMIVPPEIMEQQSAAAQQLFESFNGSLMLGLALAILSGLGEEILFRGALQPVFGIIPTSLFFILLHTQYLFTPGMLILFVVTLGFAFLRQRVSTTSAIIAHIIFNFIPFLLFTIGTMSGV